MLKVGLVMLVEAMRNVSVAPELPSSQAGTRNPLLIEVFLQSEHGTGYYYIS